MTFSVTILGSSSAFPTSNRFPSAQLVSVHERPYLVDCGEGTQTQLRKYGINIAKINHILITHLHGDHMFGIYGLISTMNMLGRTRDLNIYAPKELDAILADHLKYFGEGMTYKPVVHALNTTQSETIYENKHLIIKSLPLRHRVPTCGFLFKEKTPGLNIRKELIEKYNLSLRDIVRIKNGAHHTLESGEVIPNEKFTYLPYAPRSFAYCSDTIMSRYIIPIISEVDLLYHEATFCEDRHQLALERGHSTAMQAAQIAREANARQLVIGHYSSRYKELDQFLIEAQSVFSNSHLAEEGKVFEIPLQQEKPTPLNFYK
ncbi:MAG: ribonuclease Z [Prevotellaceae bacterium]|jgi:ribonuclease Z|nr:ribonuclease Z [Prevotellaceae bacterium]